MGVGLVYSRPLAPAACTVVVAAESLRYQPVRTLDARGDDRLGAGEKKQLDAGEAEVLGATPLREGADRLYLCLSRGAGRGEGLELREESQGAGGDLFAAGEVYMFDMNAAQAAQIAIHETRAPPLIECKVIP